MSQGEVIAGVPQRSPAEAWQALAGGRARLVDVRTRAEWTFVGLPDLSELGADPVLLEWQVWPAMARAADFESALLAAFGESPPAEIHFLCRSGARSQAAASAVQAAADAAGLQVRCCNVAEGFEGDLGPDGKRGGVNGWKARGLPWRQS
ncbi:MAG: rhodanese-like domain-containing protein [Pseudomonadota bacterium]